MRRHRQQYPTEDAEFSSAPIADSKPLAGGHHGNGVGFVPAPPLVHSSAAAASSAAEFSGIANRAFGHVGCGLVFILCMSQCGIFDVVHTDTDLSHYAERHSGKWLPAWLPMPLNTVVNFGYTICGIFWVRRVRKRFITGGLPHHSAYLFCVFAAMATAYGPVQLCRVLRMTHSLAVIDQWVTLPFFAWVPVWVWATATGHLSAPGTLAVMVASLLSYLLSVLTDLGFELALTLHVAAALGAGIFLCLYPGLSAPGLLRATSMAALSCSGFIGLKLLDHELPRLSPAFAVVSGHFLSKVADVLQIHFVCRVFECVGSAGSSGVGRKTA